MSFFEEVTEGTIRFLGKYIKDSAFYINRFFVGYNKDKLRQTLFNFGVTSSEVSSYVSSIRSYYPINKNYIYDLYLFYEAMVHQEPSKQNMVVYRGCDALDEYSMHGINATSLNKNIANIFNYGTLLKINIPAGSQFIVCSEFVNDEEEQILLSPCDYEIVSECIEIINGQYVKIVEINIKPRDILKDFSIAMQRPPKDYVDENGLDQDYLDAFEFLYQIMVRKALINYPEILLKNAVDNKDDLSYPHNRKTFDPYSDIILIDFIIKMNDKEQKEIIRQIAKKFYYVSPEEKNLILDLVNKYKKQIGYNYK